MKWIFRRAESLPASDESMPPEQGPGLVFDWARGRRSLIALAGFLLFSVLIHGSGFYLFQVVYPPPIRVEPEGDAIAVLDRRDPAVRALLQRVRDRSVLLFPSSHQEDVRLELEDLPVRFTPSFQGADPQPVSPVFEWSFPPDTAPGPRSIDPVSGLPGITISRRGGLVSRDFAPWSILADFLARAEWLPDLEVRLRAGPDGLVEVLEVKGDLDESGMAEMKEVVESTLRFSPAESENEGWIEIIGTSKDVSGEEG
jgi:hypothetical protein